MLAKKDGSMKFLHSNNIVMIEAAMVVKEVKIIGGTKEVATQEIMVVVVTEVVIILIICE